MTNPGDKFPRGEDFIIRELKALRRMITENASARSLAASSIGSGGLTVKDGGSITVEAGGNITLADGDFNAANLNASTNVHAGQDMSAGRDGTARVWNLTTGQELIRLTHSFKLRAGRGERYS